MSGLSLGDMFALLFLGLVILSRGSIHDYDYEARYTTDYTLAPARSPLDMSAAGADRPHDMWSRQYSPSWSAAREALHDVIPKPMKRRFQVRAASAAELGETPASPYLSSLPEMAEDSKPMSAGIDASKSRAPTRHYILEPPATERQDQRAFDRDGADHDRGEVEKLHSEVQRLRSKYDALLKEREKKLEMAEAIAKKIDEAKAREEANMRHRYNRDHLSDGDRKTMTNPVKELDQAALIGESTRYSDILDKTMPYEPSLVKNGLLSLQDQSPACKNAVKALDDSLHGWKDSCYNSPATAKR